MHYSTEVRLCHVHDVMSPQAVRPLAVGGESATAHSGVHCTYLIYFWNGLLSRSVRQVSMATRSQWVVVQETYD